MRFAAVAITALATSAFALPSAPVPAVLHHERGLISDVVNLLKPADLLSGLCAEGAAAFPSSASGLTAPTSTSTSASRPPSRAGAPTPPLNWMST
ncbi:hypothetical protein EYB25_009200 [Talaromyces marneffei]|nr:hypothetical protein EYB25_009200 [Talaromyces marneffei]